MKYRNLGDTQLLELYSLFSHICLLKLKKNTLSTQDSYNTWTSMFAK